MEYNRTSPIPKADSRSVIREWSLWLLILIAAVITYDIIAKAFAFPIFLVLLQVEVIVAESFIARLKV